MKNSFQQRLESLQNQYEALIVQPNKISEDGNGIFDRYRYPILTAKHIPLFWKYDLECRNQSIPDGAVLAWFLTRRAIKWGDRYIIAARVEGSDRKSFFANR